MRGHGDLTGILMTVFLFLAIIWLLKALGWIG